MQPLHEATIVCPYCWQAYETTVDGSAGAQEYVEDCQVCCHPIRVRVRVDEEGEFIGLETGRENE